MWSRPRATSLTLPRFPLSGSFPPAVGDFDYPAALMSMLPFKGHRPSLAVASQPQEIDSHIIHMSLKHIIAAAEASGSSLPLLNASLSSAFPLHSWVPAAQPAASLRPRGCPPGRLRPCTGGSPSCTPVRGTSKGDGEGRSYTPPPHSPTAEGEGDSRSPRASPSAGPTGCLR